jgi:hypothetical protein
MNNKEKEPMHMFSDFTNAEAGPSSARPQDTLHGSHHMAGEAAGPSVQFAFPEKNSNLPFPVLTPNQVRIRPILPINPQEEGLVLILLWMMRCMSVL